MDQRRSSKPLGRGSLVAPKNRFDQIQTGKPEEDWELEWAEEARQVLPKTEIFEDLTREIISENQSPDIPFRFSLNPYRGCEHGCSYCYARPFHEYWGFNAGIDFESKIVVKRDAGARFRDWLARRDWVPEAVFFSGATDCYQPLERTMRLTRDCLEVAAEANQPVSILTKNALVTRDLDLLSPMAEKGCAAVALSLTTLDGELARTLEPRASTPAARLRAIASCATAGVPVRVMVAPIIPGLTDSEVPALLKAAADAGATRAMSTILRLPGAVEEVFLDGLARNRPGEAAKVESRLRRAREGRLNDARFGHRHRGAGIHADQIQATFRLFARKYGLDGKIPPFDFSHFRPPRDSRGQGTLF